MWRGWESGSAGRSGGFILALAAVFLLVLAGLALLLLTQARLDLREAEIVWTEARLSVAAQAAARRALRELAELDADPRVPPPDPRQPEVRWSGAWTDPEGTRLEARLVDAQHRFDLNNLPAAGALPGPRDPAVGMVAAILGGFGDPNAVARVDAMRQALALGQPPESPEAPDERRFHAWADVAEIPGIGRRYLDDPSGGRPGWAGPRSALPDAFSLLPAPPRRRPVPVNVNTAARVTLQALVGPGREAPVARWLAARATAPFDSIEEAAAAAGLPPEALPVLARWLTVTSEYFEVAASAEGGGRRVRIHALARQSAGGRVEVLHWAVAAGVASPPDASPTDA